MRLLPVRVLVGLLCAVAVGAALASPASAARERGASGLWNQRYCEILLGAGEIPNLRVTVWNTIGLSRCPLSWWNGLDANALRARENASVVLLNGPRYWVIDRASTPRGGPVRRFSGQRLRSVAQLRFTSAADAARAPYAERAVVRDNTWSWRKGRRVFDLLAPGGVVYRMQAYSQIVDRTQRLGDLRGLGARLRLPEGWRFRTRVLRRGYDLRTRGTATIIQDELQNTYQRVP